MPDMETLVQDIVQNAGKILMKHFRDSKLKVGRKEGGGLVTDADRLSEGYITKRLKEEFPQSTILAEESGGKVETGGMKWIIDPLDGTSNFVHGLPWFCVSVALEVEGEIELGCILNPVNDEMFFSKKGSGAFLNGSSISVSQETDLENCLFATGLYYFKGEELNKQLVRIQKVKQASLGVRRFGSAALDLAYTARGFFDGFWEVGLMPWDVAAGSLLVKEAGGIVTDLTSSPDFVYNRNVIASNQSIYSKLLWLL
jgi:myo-inositol-1(or 4)-monophosphatase